mgnify:FL=1
MIAYIIGYLVMFFINVVFCEYYMAKDNFVLTYLYFTYMCLCALALISLIVSIDFSRAMFIIGYAFTFIMYVCYEVYNFVKK